MDNPLSAINTHVSEHIFEHAICGLLKNKGRILTLISYIYRTAGIKLHWYNGKIQAVDAYASLRQRSADFHRLITLSIQHKEEGDGNADPRDHSHTDDRIERIGTSVSLHGGSALMTVEGKTVKIVQ
ncbi:uncharacterized protein ATNIH1004_008847 [Aspergillus tanneri]|uniref:Uncharacterized protein n=1 Tax=Aspergillus tanneri TaxID=1220188 RepID=A0A5M9MCJ8_9EURO|nr:uncharacterized protein ATNIH1004_008847 [Aspergillus tanneri]KAA8644641.1 hypothetical protein ATNIH1004_008847 [Aspergillus tanneri]